MVSTNLNLSTRAPFPSRARGQTQNTSDPRPSVHRLVAIDFLKAISSITVVAIHSFFLRENQRPKFLELLGAATRFAVPAFLFASGFLSSQRRTEDPFAFLGRRLIRLVIPYLVASLITIASGLGDGRPLSAMGIFSQLALGSAWGPYYYVFVAVTLTLITPIILRLPRAALVTCLVAFTVGAYWAERYPLTLGGFFWSMRHPLRWWGYYLAGVLSSGLLPMLEKQPVKRRFTTAFGFSLLSVVLLVLKMILIPFSSSAALAQLALIYATIVAIVAWGMILPKIQFVSWLSEVSYPIYLYHLFFVRSFVRPAHPWPSLAERGTAFVASVPLTLAFVWVARRLLGRRAKLLLG